MFKFVFCVLFAFASAKPDVLLTSPLSPLTYVAPATTTITKSASGFINPGPLVYSSALPYAHFIKKREAPLTYIAPTTYLSKPLLTTYSAPLVQSPAIWSSASLPIATHFIKKRSPQVLAPSYIAPTAYAASAPLWSSSLSTPLVSSSIIAPTSYVSEPISYATHLIKKRSAPLISTYAAAAPAAITYDTRFDLRGAPLVNAAWPYSPAIAAYSHVI